MELAIPIVAIIIAIAGLWLLAANAITICVIDVRNGHAKIRRGGIAPRVFADVGDVVKKPRIERATIRIVKNRGHARVELRGKMRDAQAQQLRNVIGSVPLAKLVNARRK